MRFSSEKDQEEKGHFTQSLEAIRGDKRDQDPVPLCMSALLLPWKVSTNRKGEMPGVPSLYPSFFPLYLPVINRFDCLSAFTQEIFTPTSFVLLLFHLIPRHVPYQHVHPPSFIPISLFILTPIHLFSIATCLVSHIYLPASPSTCLPLAAQHHFCPSTKSHCAWWLSSSLLSWQLCGVERVSCWHLEGWKAYLDSSTGSSAWLSFVFVPDKSEGSQSV